MWHFTDFFLPQPPIFRERAICQFLLYHPGHSSGTPWLMHACSVTSVMSDSFVTPQTVPRQVPLSARFFWQEYRSGLPCPTPGGSSQPRDQTHVPCISCIAGRFFTAEEAPMTARTYYYSKSNLSFRWGHQQPLILSGVWFMFILSDLAPKLIGQLNSLLLCQVMVREIWLTFTKRTRHKAARNGYFRAPEHSDWSEQCRCQFVFLLTFTWTWHSLLHIFIVKTVC